MASAKDWISAFRLRTLPLALSCIFVGSLLAAADGFHSLFTTVFAVVTTLFLQILSNLANDYGDGVKGTDNEQRIGPQRTVQSGAVSRKEMKFAVILFSVLSLASGIFLSYGSLPEDELPVFFGFVLLGAAAVWAAVKYTVGSGAYGYRGMGDLFVFLFFGIVGVCGTYYLHGSQLPLTIFLPASAVGMLSAGVLNLNNMRDLDNDRESGKNTLPVLLGIRFARIYHTFLLVLPVLFTATYIFLKDYTLWNFLYLATLPLLGYNLRVVFRSRNPSDLDPLLKQLALTTFVFSVLFGIGFLI